MKRLRVARSPGSTSHSRRCFFSVNVNPAMCFFVTGRAVKGFAFNELASLPVLFVSTGLSALIAKLFEPTWHFHFFGLQKGGSEPLPEPKNGSADRKTVARECRRLEVPASLKVQTHIYDFL